MKNQLLCTSIRTKPVSKSALVFLKLNEASRGKVHIPRNGTLKTVIIKPSSLIYNVKQLDLYFNSEVARCYLLLYSVTV